MEGYLNQMYLFCPHSSQSQTLSCLDKKCDLALRVSVISGSVKLPETEPGLPSPPHPPTSPPAPSHIICTIWENAVAVGARLLHLVLCGAPGKLTGFWRCRTLKHTSSALKQCDYGLNHCQLGRREAQWHRLTMRRVISLFLEKF